MGKYISRYWNVRHEIEVLHERLYNYNKELCRNQNKDKKKRTLNDDNLERFYKRKIGEIKKHLGYS